ncbi:unnamed protein product [Rotaria socialis]|uniref:Uncharacterized protein n=1 Tax=Rotaria socialis TaxID=392032 RepID=A0A820LWH9_9BILA|nr:unnamed protein product [Rotaria socialis]CAF4363559.1 unnamed protein product [Rotaria socialis]
MSSAQLQKGRGRARSTTHSAAPPPPSITPSTDISTTSTPLTFDNSSTSDSPAIDQSVSPPAITTDQSRPDTGYSSISTSSQPSPPTRPVVTTARGRADRLKRNVAPEDPHWTVSDLTAIQFQSNTRPVKPDELGTIGQPIQVIANYFPILQYPRRGLVYRYHIQIHDWKNLEIHRDRRRLVYNLWLQQYCGKYTKIDRHKIVFDNLSTILTFNQPLFDIDGTATVQEIKAPNRSNRLVTHKVIVRRAGEPIDLALIQNFDEILHTENRLNNTPQDLDIIKQILSIALHENCSFHATAIYDRLFFAQTTPEQHGEWDLGLGKALWRGFYSCLVFSKGAHHLLMNLDINHGVFMKKQPFLEFLCEIMLHSPCGKKRYGGRQRNVQKVHGDDVLEFLDIRNPTYQIEMNFLLKHCKNVRVRSQDASKPIVYSISKLGKSASTQEFIWKGSKNKTVTVENYYKEHYGLVLKYPSLPTLEMHNRSYIPMELVDVEPARVKKITDEQRALMCRQSTMHPSVYIKSINEIRKNPKKQCFEEDPFIAAWNMNVSTDMLTLPARVLPMPEIVYTDQYHVTSGAVRDMGTWQMKPTRFHTPAKFPAVWGMINLSSLDQHACEDFYNELSNIAVERGMECCPPVIYEEYDSRKSTINGIIGVLNQILKKNKGCNFFVVILSVNGKLKSDLYGLFKKLCELEFGHGAVTQMIQQRNAVVGKQKDKARWDYAKLNNILLKINTKLNGINAVLKVHDVIERFFSHGHRVMYVGADLSHAPPSARSQPSVVAVVASADDVPSRYFKEVYQQHRPESARNESREYIVDMKAIMKSLIQQYERHRGYPPNAIVMYRDGISESEFDTVFEKELTAIREACVELSPVYRPYLTYIVVNKRHHTRFFPTNSDKNVQAGTVVDSHDITNPTTYDFYLNSHHGALGTSRPTHYHVLYDDNKLRPDEVQMLTYALCYTYARCTRSVSIPAPVKYADLLALRGTYYVGNTDDSDTESIVSEPLVAVGEEKDIKNTITSERIVLSGKIANDCPFFL